MKGKRILILGGASVHCKLVEAAKEMGLYTIVTDYLPSSPAKEIADKSYMLNITDVDGIVEMCRRECVEAVLSTHLDPCQRPYQEICQRLGLPCYGTREQFFLMTDKRAFKRLCKAYGVDVVSEYSVEDVALDRVEYPVFVKPVDSRGSRGQNVCWDKKTTQEAIAAARQESSNGDILIEKYLGTTDEVQITYFFVDGEPYLIRTVDSHRGSPERHLDKVVACSASPSRYTEEYMQTAHECVVNMFKAIGFRNGPIFMQGFYDQGKFRFFDPGLRFPGVDYDRIYPYEYHVDLIKMMITFAVKGHFEQKGLPKDMFALNGKRVAVLFPVIRAGTIAQINGIEEMMENPHVFSYSQRHEAGDNILWTYNVNQRFAEIDIIGENHIDLCNVINRVYKQLTVLDESGNNMLYDRFDVSRI